MQNVFLKRKKTCICIRYQASTLKPPPTPDLPDFRLFFTRSFQAAGLDYAGPLNIRINKDTFNAYILLFTCASSRAIHLELVYDLAAPSFLRAFRRFTARRDIPDIIVHDNAKTFKSKATKRFMVQSGIEQHFILPASPWWGGFYERLVRSVKMSLRKVLGRSLLSFEELQTILCDIELVINNRPLVYQSDDDINQVLTPWHLLHGRNNSKLLRSAGVPVEINTIEEASKRYQFVCKILNDFWNRFKANYLNEVRQSNIYRKQNLCDKRELTVGDVVLIRNDTLLPRHRWPMGKVVELVKGKNGHVRGAKLSTTTVGDRKTSCYRPIQKLIPFEISKDEDTPDETFSESEIKESEEIEEEQRKGRKAKSLGQYERRLRDKYL